MIGFLGVCAAFSLMTAAFGLLIATLGKTRRSHARPGDSGHAADGDARRRVGADLHFPEVAARDHRGVPDALGDGRPGRGDLARPGLLRGRLADRAAVRLRAGVRGGGGDAVPMGSGLTAPDGRGSITG